MTNTCTTIWHDDFGNQPDHHCTLPANHTGPHHNTPHGTTWGGPTEWNLT